MDNYNNNCQGNNDNNANGNYDNNANNNDNDNNCQGNNGGRVLFLVQPAYRWTIVTIFINKKNCFRQDILFVGQSN